MAQHSTARDEQAGRPPGAVGYGRSTETIAVLVESMTKTYGIGPSTIRALDNVSLSFPAGSFTAVMGPSGSGKSTLLQCAAGLDRPSSGRVSIGGTELSGLSETALTRLRRDRVGFVFQSFNLMPSLTAAQNVELPLRLAGRKADQQAIRAALATVGLADRARHRPSELSGGQQQRVAIARALVTSPQVLFADEPTGALDTSTSRHVLELLSGLVTERRQTVIMVTHDPMAAAYADRVIFLADGRVADTLERPTAEAIAARMTRLEVSAPTSPPATLARPGPDMLTAALATVRTRWAAFASTFAALALGVSVIAMMALVLAAASGGNAHQRPERFAAAAYVIQVDPNLQVRDRNGSLDSVPLLAQPAVPPRSSPSCPARSRDRTFYAQVQGAPAAQPALGHGWSSAGFAPYVLTSGHAPRSDNEIVVAGPATLGSRVSVLTAGGARDYTISGTVRPRTGEQPVFFSDAEAARLSPGSTHW